MASWQDWSSWIQEGHFISYIRDNARYYEHVTLRDLAHYMYQWPSAIPPLTESAMIVDPILEITRGVSADGKTNYLWQMIFGIMGQVYIYVELPTDTHRHGVPKAPKPSTALREVSHFEEYMSPYFEPSFITEHIMCRPENLQIAWTAYNPNAIAITPRLNIFIAKLVTERIGTEQDGVLTPTSARWKDTLNKLYSRTIPHRPLTLLPVVMPAAAPTGE